MASPSSFTIPSFQNKFSTPNSMFSVDTTKSPPPSGGTYLPGFLLGNYSTSPMYGRSMSNTGCPTSPVFGRSLSSVGYQNHSPTKINSKSPPNRQSGYPYSMERKKKRISSNNSSSQDGAPPTESLYTSNDFVSSCVNEVDVLKKNVLNGSILSSKQLSKSLLGNSMFRSHSETIPQSPAQIDPFYTQGDAISSSDVIDDTAVTVFGFPSAASSFILQQFAQYGIIEKHEIHNIGNWLHLKYQNKIQAKKALSKNGKIFARTIMVGVCPCIKKEIATMEAEVNSSSVVGTPQIVMKKTLTMRPLSITNSSLRRSASDISGSMTSDRGTPKKRDSLIGKAFDYVFGW